MRAFILRPFGKKDGIEFDKVDNELLSPALFKLGFSARTSSEIIGGGNIRTDMFEGLLASDIVLADISVPNANVFYSLGLAHALRDKRTVLLSASDSERQPFDLVTDRHLRYDAQNPSASIQQLVNLLQATTQSDRIDSPVYALLPGLRPPRATILPPDFMSELKRASENRDLGHLRLLSHEARSFHWAAEALKNVGNEQYRVDLTGARETFEYVISIAPHDTDANLRLGLLYQRLKEPRRAAEVINRALESLEPDSKHRAEAFQLLGRNAKRAWEEVWRSRSEPEWRAAALRSSELNVAYEYYLKAFKQDLNEYYWGLNALALGTIIVHLADELPLVWTELFENDDEAHFRLSTLKKEIPLIAGGVALSLDAASERHPGPDVWLEISRADFELLMSDRAVRVKEKYRRALSDAPTFVTESVLSQTYIYRDLGVRLPNVQAAIEALGGSNLPVVLPPVPTTKRALLFVGHAIDAPGRASPRFPPSSEPAAREAIVRAVEEEVKGDLAAWVGIAGASSGGDILFHEICESLGIVDTICLALPETEYATFGVVEAGPQWVNRFRELIARHRVRVLSDSPELPRWLRDNAPYEFWDRDTMWRYHTAAAIGDITLLALWDGKEGAAANLVRMAKERGAKIVILDAVSILGVDASRQPHAAT